MKAPEIRISSDGSHTLYIAGTDEHYHSTYGALTESRHVFIRNGLLPLLEKYNTLHILEIGFGTGLNALLTCAVTAGKEIVYHAVEAYPLEPEIWKKLNYPELIGGEHTADRFDKMHASPWGKEVQIRPGFSLYKQQEKAENLHLPERYYHLVYFDAFAPEVQPGLWTTEIFTNIGQSMKHGGILVTYSSKGLVKQNLRAAGFSVKRLPGPPGKRHMVVAERR